MARETIRRAIGPRPEPACALSRYAPAVAGRRGHARPARSSPPCSGRRANSGAAVCHVTRPGKHSKCTVRADSARKRYRTNSAPRPRGHLDGAPATVFGQADRVAQRRIDDLEACAGLTHLSRDVFVESHGVSQPRFVETEFGPPAPVRVRHLARRLERASRTARPSNFAHAIQP